MSAESSSQTSKRTLEEGPDVGRKPKRPTRGANQGTAPSNVEKKKLPEELKQRIEGLVKTETPEDQEKYLDDLKATCTDVKAIDPNFSWSSFSRNKADNVKRLGFEGRDLDLVTSLGERTTEMDNSMRSTKWRTKLQTIREKARNDRTLLPATDPFADEPIQFNNKDLHSFDPNDLEKLSDDEAHNALKLILRTVNHTAVGLNTLDLDRVIMISDGMQAVLTYMENRAVQPVSPLELTEVEKNYIVLAKHQFSGWKSAAKRAEKKKRDDA